MPKTGYPSTGRPGFPMEKPSQSSTSSMAMRNTQPLREFVVDELLPAGYAVFGTDHRGHGKSDGRRGHVKSFQDYIDDEKQFALEVIKPALPDVPYLLVGHSMGSLITLNYASSSRRESRPSCSPAPALSRAAGRISKVHHRPHQGTCQYPPEDPCEITAAAGIHLPGSGGGEGICKRSARL